MTVVLVQGGLHQAIIRLLNRRLPSSNLREAATYPEAIHLLEGNPANAVVADLSPEGRQLLAETGRRWPSVRRAVAQEEATQATVRFLTSR